MRPGRSSRRIIVVTMTGVIGTGTPTVGATTDVLPQLGPTPVTTPTPRNVVGTIPATDRTCIDPPCVRSRRIEVSGSVIVPIIGRGTRVMNGVQVGRVLVVPRVGVPPLANLLCLPWQEVTDGRRLWTVPFA